MSDHAKLEGVFTPNIVPLDDSGKINEGELRRYVDWLIEKGVNGLYPNGSTAEFTRFTVDERRRIVQIVIEQAAGRVPVIAGAAEANVRETLDVCRYYDSLGARAVAVVSPFYYRASAEGVYAYFKAIADDSPIDVTLYNIPMCASPIPVDTVLQLAEECPRIIGLKDSSGDLQHMMRMISAVRAVRPDFYFMAGWDALLMPMLLMGCNGGVLGTSGVVPELTKKLYDWTRDGRLDEAVQLQYHLMTLFDTLVFSIDYPHAFRYAVKLRGFDVGASRHPLSEEQQQQMTKIINKTRGFLSESGLDDTSP